MKKIIASLVVLTFFIVPIKTHADQYIGVGLTQLQYDETGDISGSDYDLSIDLNGIEPRYGVEFTDVFSGEIRAGRTNEGSGELLGIDSTVQYDWYISGYGKATLNSESLIKPYALLGYTYGDIGICVSGGGTTSCTGSNTGSDISYGLGFETDRDGTLNYYLEWKQYYSTDDVDISGFTIGMVQKY